MNETLSTSNGRNVLRMERRLAHQPEKVWRAITEPEHLSQWYPFPVIEMDLQVGGKILFGVGPDTVMDAVVTEFDPPRVFSFSEHPPAQMTRENDDLVRFEIRPESGGCLLIFTHVFDDRPAAASYAAGWHTCLNALETVAGGGTPQWPAGDMADLHQRYVEEFGLAEGSAVKEPDGWTLRYERQLTRPIEEIWSRLGGREARVGGPAPWAADGVVTAVDAPWLLEFKTGEEGREKVRCELSQGTGHGARLVLVHTGLAEPDEARASWRTRIERLAKALIDD